MSIKELKKELAQVKKDMKLHNIKRKSCFNGGLTEDERYFNGRIFELECLIRNSK